MIDAVVRALAEQDAWLVGGAVRDLLLGRPTDDYDVTVTGDAERIAKALPGAAFPLGDTFGGWRVVGRGEHVDLLPLQGGSLAADLAARDFTVNAMALPLAALGVADPRKGPAPLRAADPRKGPGPLRGCSDLVDLFGGADDLAARTLRAVGPQSFASDALRVLRLVRLGAELGFAIEPATEAAARDAAPALTGVAAERIFAELRRIVLQGSAAVRAFEDVGAADVVLPELVALKGMTQSVYHHLDVHDHTLAVLDAVGDLQNDEQDPRVIEALGAPLANDLDHWGAMRFAALIHDIAKPETSGVRADGKGTSFVGHDQAGAEMGREILRRLRASEKLVDYVAALTRHHLRLGFLVHHQPLDRRDVFRYLTKTAPWSLDVTLFTCADRLATRGRNHEAAITAHLELARRMIDASFAPQAAPLIRGDDLARELGVRGAQIGELLAQLAEDAYAGEIATREQALTRARELTTRG